MSSQGFRTVLFIQISDQVSSLDLPRARTRHAVIYIHCRDKHPAKLIQLSIGMIRICKSGTSSDLLDEQQSDFLHLRQSDIS